MGYLLYREVKNTSLNLTPGERLVAWAIADDADEVTRRSTFLPVGELAAQTGLTLKSVSDALSRLAARGYEFRAPITKGGKSVLDKKGRPVFACRGRRTEYVIPHLPQRAGADRTIKGPVLTGALGAERSGESAQRSGESTQRSGGDRTPLLSTPHNSFSARASDAPVRSVFPDASDAEIEMITGTIKEKHHPGNLPAYIAALAANGDLRLPCDGCGAGRHSQACRNSDSAACDAYWCTCRCHTIPAAG